MSKVFTFLMLIIFVPLFSSLFAQQENDDREKDIIDSELRNEEKDYDDFGFYTLFSKKTDPTIELSFGGTKSGIRGFESSLGNTGTANLRIGYTKYSRYYKHLVKLNHTYAVISNVTSGLVTRNNAEISPELWCFGFGHFYGYGYKVADISIVPYSSNSMIWTYSSFKNMQGSMPAGDIENLSLYNESIRFGSATEGGIKVLCAPFLTFSAGYEKSVVFPRHLFWKQSGSMMIEYLGLGAIDEFVKRVIKTSPYAGPVVDFVLKNGYLFAFYELRKDKMNWPFGGAAPLSLNTWKIGMTFIF